MFSTDLKTKEMKSRSEKKQEDDEAKVGKNKKNKQINIKVL